MTDSIIKDSIWRLRGLPNRQTNSQALTPKITVSERNILSTYIVHSDTRSRIETPTTEGYRYYGTYIDDATGMTAVVPTLIPCENPFFPPYNYNSFIFIGSTGVDGRQRMWRRHRK